MNFKNISVAIAIGTTILLSACGGGEKKSASESIVKPKSTSLKGDLKPYFEVVDKEYKIKVDEESFMKSGMITVEIKRTDTDFDFKTDNINPFGTNGSEDYHVGFGIEILDDSGPVVIKNATEGGMGGPYSSEDVTGIINLGKGETGYIRWSIDEGKLEGLKSFQITSALQAETHDNSYSSSDDYEDDSDMNSGSVASSGSKDWDEMLDDYEEYVDEYIKFYKKAMKGDNSAMSEYPAMMEKATALQTSMAKAQNNNELSTTQIQRMMKIQTKMTNAALEMQN